MNNSLLFLVLCMTYIDVSQLYGNLRLPYILLLLVLYNVDEYLRVNYV